MRVKEKLASLREHPVFYTVLAASCVAALYSVWCVPWPPFGDFGGHIEIMDVFARGDDPATAYPDTYYVAHRLAPNTLSSHLAWLLYPLLDAHQTGQLLLGFYAVGFPITMAVLARAFGRSPWLGLLGIPHSYNGLLVMGALNFLIGLPLLFLSIGLARFWIDTGERWQGVALGCVLVVGYFAHLITFGISLAICAVLLALHASTRKEWRRLLALTPACPLLVVWLLGVRGGMEGEGGSLGLVYESGATMLAHFPRWVMSIFKRSNVDDYTFVLMGWLWLLGFTLRADAPRAPENNTDTPEKDNGSRLVTALHWLRARDLEVITLCCVAVWPVLPAHMSEVSVINQRVIIVFVVLLAIWPRVGAIWRPSRVVVAPIAVIAIVYPFFAAGQFKAFEDEVLGDLPEAIEGLPEGSFLGYTFHDPDNPVTIMGATWHIPKGIHAVENGGITDDSFAWRPTTAVQYKPGQTPQRPGWEFWRGQHLMRMDYVLFRGATRPSNPTLGNRTRLIFHQREWWLYQVRPYTEWEEVTMHAGGGALAVSSGCPQRGVLAGIAIGKGRDALLSLQPLCRLDGDEWWQNPSGLGKQGAETRVEQRCEPGTRAVGLHGHAGDQVDELGLICGARGRDSDSLVIHRPVGRRGGDEFELLCPDGYAMTRLLGVRTAPLQGAGVLCQPM